MKAHLIHWLHAILRWLDPSGDIVVSFPRGKLFKEAQRLIQEVEPIHNGGEARRHQVYAALIKLFPHTPKTELSLAIELAIQER